MNKKINYCFTIILMLAFVIFLPSDKANAATTKEISNLTYFDTKGDQLRYGKYGESVYKLKSFLSDMNYKITKLNYTFDKQTKDAVIKFQKDQELKADGVVGKNTFTIINNIIKSENIILPTFTLVFDKKVPEGNWIIINKSNNTLYWLKKSTLIKTYPVATGSKPTYTPEGKFKIVMKAVNPAWGGGGYASPIAGGKSNNPLGKRWMGLDKGGGGRYGIHGNANESSIGTFASHGCIRMHNSDVVELYTDVKNNTPVWIGTGKSLKELGVSIVASNQGN